MDPGASVPRQKLTMSDGAARYYVVPEKNAAGRTISYAVMDWTNDVGMHRFPIVNGDWDTALSLAMAFCDDLNNL